MEQIELQQSKRKMSFLVYPLLGILLSGLLGAGVFLFYRNHEDIPADTTNDSLDTSQITIGNDNDSITLDVEIADTFEEQKAGLMNRESLSDSSGMLFVFDEAESRSFWMKNTLIPLDMVFFNQNKEYVSVVRDAQPCPPEERVCPSYKSEGEAMYVLETNPGVVEDHILEESRLEIQE